jgi:hypothetical protein
MKTSLKMLAIGSALVIAVAATAHAQATSGTTRAARIERAKERGAVMRQRAQSLSPEQKAALKAYRDAYRAERKSLSAQVKAGTLDKKSAAEQLKAWRQANRPKKS